MFHQHFASILSNAQRPWASDTTSLTSQGQSERKSHRVSPFQTEGMSSHAAHFRHFTWIHSSIKASEAICRACCTIFYYIVSNYRSNMFHLYKNNIKYVYIYIQKRTLSGPHFPRFWECSVSATSCSIIYVHIPVMVLLEIHTDCQTSSGLAKGCQRMSRESWRFPGKRKEEKQT